MDNFEPFGSESTQSTSVPTGERPTDVLPPGVSTVPSTNPEQRVEPKLNSLLRSDYHLTVQLGVHLERRQISLLLSVLSYQAIHFGVTFPMYLMILHLYEVLLGNKIRASLVKDRFERLSVLLSQVIIRDMAGKDLSFEEPVSVSSKTRELALKSKALITKDTYKSRFVHWRPERFLRLKTVPVDVIIERSGNSVRYTSYCKGYGEGTGTARRGKTPICFELDGEETTEWVLSDQLDAKELAQEVFLLAHFEWLKRFGRET